MFHESFVYLNCQLYFKYLFVNGLNKAICKICHTMLYHVKNDIIEKIVMSFSFYKHFSLYGYINFFIMILPY